MWMLLIQLLRIVLVGAAWLLYILQGWRVVISQKQTSWKLLGCSSCKRFWYQIIKNLNHGGKSLDLFWFILSTIHLQKHDYTFLLSLCIMSFSLLQSSLSECVFFFLWESFTDSPFDLFAITTMSSKVLLMLTIFNLGFQWRRFHRKTK